ncbi:MAG: rhomboid family intramembrane serine protease [Candidatus Electrothrix sp. LOE2]|nr:rhomboid family intramembrane serine protease [Candidatus Electrothrix sp. LOE2]
MKLGAATIPVYLICTIWAVYLVDLILPIRLNAYGIVPRTLGGLPGIPLTNFLHVNLRHLISNTVPLFVLSLLLTLFYRKIFFNVLIVIIGCGGLLVWIFARTANHIGASMLIYGLAAFLISYGLLKREIITVIVSVVVALVYGLGMLGGMLPVHGFISWEGHLFGAVGGVFAAYLFRKR